ncbi:Uncharacterised protein [Mycobacteroides abscessus subsp. abscessus]|uniref:hypothetical protein n=1 Tax=Mycobacteroides abscessus TaxID=36809 RepID=UPI00092A0E3C|nr:hypothetical protein [Mycobacteroides abscessus]SIM25313.1 Uncharacterised protein [Mycobacteroides abscessus subsp. abscessus]SLC78951.1 Uncharacterised protein [Mycobacteroides abscessus subsp. abscessus]
MTELDHTRVRVDDDQYYTRLDFQPLEKAIPVQDAWLNLMFDTIKSMTGTEAQSLHDLQVGGSREAVPVLASYLYRIPSRNIQCGILSVLGKKQYRPDSVDALIKAYRDFAGAHDRGGTRMQWYISDAIDGPVSEKQIEEIFGLIDELPNKLDADFLLAAVARTKKQRERVVLLIKEVLESALANNDNPDDPAPVAAGIAVSAAGKLRDPRLYAPLKVMADTPNTWMRDRVKRALAQCEPKQENKT